MTRRNKILRAYRQDHTHLGIYFMCAYHYVHGRWPTKDDTARMIREHRGTTSPIST